VGVSVAVAVAVSVEVTVGLKVGVSLGVSVGVGVGVLPPRDFFPEATRVGVESTTFDKSGVGVVVGGGSRET